MTETAERHAGLGRPFAGEPAAIALAAVTLFLERGYDAVTMTDVAEAAGIGRSTLFRYFPTKGSLLWFQQDLHHAQFRAELAAVGAGVPLADGVFDAFLRFFERHRHELGLAKGIIAVIARSPASSTGKWDAFAQWSGYIAEHAASRLGGSADDLERQALGAALWAAIVTAEEHWALSDEAELEPFIRRAQAALAGRGGAG